MKTNKRLFVLFCMLLLVMAAIPASANNNTPIRVYVDGQEVHFPDQKPYMDKNYRTLVPVRFVSEALGAKVDWNNKLQQVTITDESVPSVIKLWIGRRDYTVNGVAKIMDTHAVLTEKKRTMVPIRFVSEGLGLYVDYAEVEGVGLVFNFTKAVSKEERTEIIERIKDEVKQELGQKPSSSIKTVTKENFNQIPRALDTATMTGKDLGIGKLIGGDLNHHFNKAFDEAKVTIIKKNQLPYRVGGTAIIDIKIDEKASDKTWAEGKVVVTLMRNEDIVMPSMFFIAKDFYSRGTMYAKNAYEKTDVRVKLVDPPTDYPRPTVKLEDIKYFGFKVRNEILLVENPDFKGGF